MATRKCSNTITIDILHRISMHVYSGTDTGFSKRGGWDPRYEKRCGRGCPLQARDEKGGGRGAIRFRPDTKSGGGGGGLLSASGPIQKAGCVCVWGGGVMLST